MRTLLLAAALVTLSASCTTSSDSDGGESAASCANDVTYQNRTYSGTHSAKITTWEKLGVATRAPCDDTPNDDEDGRTEPTTTAYAVEGVDPAIAIWVQDASDDVLFVAAESGKELPPEVRKLIHGS
ncbi:DUF6281 family protein [Streptomyces laculatispora]|uniref:DUF6281 family protein n=1 Tax=Streptomyces laculatispora TaxID=887464 RepID=UPI001A93BC96|nr:DUF6281 family protein [Streptomyces laculatispora]MBO0919043.1 hypothetical protein [Streptomyces laculatispora]